MDEVYITDDLLLVDNFKWIVASVTSLEEDWRAACFDLLQVLLSYNQRLVV